MTQQLTESPIFNALPASTIKDIENLVETITLDAGDILFEKGDPGGHLYTIIDGLLKISVPDENSGRQKTLALLGDGEVVGEMATLGDQSRSGQAIAVKKTELIQITENDFLTMIKDHPEIGLNLIKVLSKRLLMSDEELQTVTFQTIPGRLAAQLLRLAEKFGVNSDEGIRIDIGLTHQQISDLVGTNRETVTRFLNKFKSEGSIDIDDHHITIKDQDSLEEWM